MWQYGDRSILFKLQFLNWKYGKDMSSETQRLDPEFSTPYMLESEEA